MICVPTHRSPTHPGEMLLEEFLTPMGLSNDDVAKAIHVTSRQLNEIISERQNVTKSIALRLAKFFGMSADFWMNVQLRWELHHAQLAESETLNTIGPHAV